MRRQEVSHLGFPGAETPKHQTLSMLHYFGVSSIGISRVKISRLANTWGPHLGTPGAEIPKYNNFSTLYLFGISQVGISGLASTRELALGYSGCRNTEISGFSYTLSFRDFACRDFGTCEYKGIRPWVFWVPKCRNIVTYLHAIISGFRKSGFRDLRVQGNSPLGFLDTETPKYQLLNLLILFQGFFHRDFASRGFGTCEYKETHT
jgi:hypothetical protein